MSIEKPSPQEMKQAMVRILAEALPWVIVKMPEEASHVFVILPALYAIGWPLLFGKNTWEGSEDSPRVVDLFQSNHEAEALLKRFCSPVRYNPEGESHLLADREVWPASIEEDLRSHYGIE